MLNLIGSSWMVQISGKQVTYRLNTRWRRRRAGHCRCHSHDRRWGRRRGSAGRGREERRPETAGTAGRSDRRGCPLSWTAIVPDGGGDVASSGQQGTCRGLSWAHPHTGLTITPHQNTLSARVHCTAPCRRLWQTGRPLPAAARPRPPLVR